MKGKSSFMGISAFFHITFLIINFTVISVNDVTNKKNDVIVSLINRLTFVK